MQPTNYSPGMIKFLRAIRAPMCFATANVKAWAFLFNVIVPKIVVY